MGSILINKNYGEAPIWLSDRTKKVTDIAEVIMLTTKKISGHCKDETIR